MSTELLTAIEQCVQQLGYNSHIGTKQRVNSTITKSLSAWIEPPSVTQIEGIDHGRIRYKSTLYLIQIAPNASLQTKQQIWDKHIRECWELKRLLLGDSKVLNISNINITPMEDILTNKGDITSKIETLIEMIICR